MRISLPARTALAATALLTISARAASAQTVIADSVRIGINRVFATWTDADGLGCALGVSRNGRVLFQNGYGMANLETGTPITPATIFHVASISKQFTAASALLLEKDGKLSLDDEVRKHLPELPDYGHRITLRHLLTHTSGMRDQWDLLAMARGRFEEDRITENDVLDIVPRQKALNFAPGTEYLYSNTGFTLAGTIVRRVSGTSLRDFAQARIFAPLGMTHTHFHDDYTMLVKGRASAYVRGDDGRWHVSIPNFDTYGATSLFTTVGDLLKWTANASTPVVGDAEMMRRMATSAVLANGDTSGYGLGLTREVYRGATVIGHGGADAGYRAHIATFPEHKLSIAVMCNAGNAVPAALMRGVADVVLRDSLTPAPEPARALVTPSEATLARMAGVWVDSVTGAPTFITRRGNALLLGRTSGPALVPLTETRFAVTGQPVEFSLTTTGLQRRTTSWPTRTPVQLMRREVAKPTRAALDRLTGTYYSEELGATYVVTATDSSVTLKTRWAEPMEFLPAYGDTFVGFFQVAFTRGRNGAVDGMRMSSGRSRDVRFVKTVR
jgi:CubicO group peptidase (beta-lactamase class C family)